MSHLVEFLSKHVERGDCTCGKCIDASPNPKQPTGHTADLIFFKVRLINEPNRGEFEEIIKAEFPHWLDGKEHSYLETGADVGDQGLAMMAMGAGALLDVWNLLTPDTVLGPDLDPQLRMQMAGSGFITIKVDRVGV